MKDKTKINPLKPIIYFFSRYNLIIFVIIITTGLSLAVLTLTAILQVPYDGSVSGSNKTVTFDESTITRLKSLNASNKNAANTPELSGRASLFAE